MSFDSPSMSSSPSRLSGLLLRLEAELVASGLWQSTPPAASALQSSAPFACDTLAFEAWLQFIFIPRFTLLLRTNQSLPKAMAILPMAEHVWRDEFESVKAIIAALDAAVNQSPNQFPNQFPNQ